MIILLCIYSTGIAIVQSSFVLVLVLDFIILFSRTKDEDENEDEEISLHTVSHYFTPIVIFLTCFCGLF